MPCLRKIGQIVELMRYERYRFAPARRIYIPKKNGKLRPLGLPSWSGKLVGEVVRLLLEAICEPVFSDQSHGFRKGRGCHTALREIRETWTLPRLDPREPRPARGINRWRARCAERRTPGSEGGCTEKARIHTGYGTSLCSPPYSG
jgi:retron-type reverse transcriptase